MRFLRDSTLSTVLLLVAACNEPKLSATMTVPSRVVVGEEFTVEFEVRASRTNVTAKLFTRLDFDKAVEKVGTETPVLGEARTTLRFRAVRAGSVTFELEVRAGEDVKDVRLTRSVVIEPAPATGSVLYVDNLLLDHGNGSSWAEALRCFICKMSIATFG
jgi:hypothetical protein